MEPQVQNDPGILSQRFLAYSVVDSNGNTVTFDEPPERIVAFDSAAVETLFAMGEGHRIIGTHSMVTYPPETKNITKVGDAFNMNIEATVALEPDLVFIFFDTFLEDLKKVGLKVLYLESLNNKFEKTTDNIRMWGQIVGNVEAAETSIIQFDATVSSVKKSIDSVEGSLRVFQDVGGLWTPGPNTLVGEVFSLLNLENIAHDITGYAQLSPEIIVDRNPHIIITSDPELIKGNPAFKNIIAVTEEKFISMPEALSIAGPRFAEGIQELMVLVYPNIFPPSNNAKSYSP